MKPKGKIRNEPIFPARRNKALGLLRRNGTRLGLPGEAARAVFSHPYY